jgi:glycosyltransferase involved in cell wall biosynthesis
MIRKVIYVHHERAIGGAPLSLLYLVRMLDRSKYEPAILCLREGPAADLFRKEGLSVEIVEGPDLSHTELVWFRWWQWPRLLVRMMNSVSFYFRLKKVLKRFLTNGKPPIVHLNSSTLLVAGLAARSLGLPVVWHIREPLAKGYFGIRRKWWGKWIRSLGNRIIAISNYDAAQLGKDHEHRISVVHNFVDFTLFDHQIPQGKLVQELGITSQEPIILFLGGSAEVKGAEILLLAIPEILGKLKHVHMVLAGEMSEEFTHRAKTPPLSAFRERVHLVGVRHDVPSLIRDSMVLVFPSIVPHFARPVIEASAMKKAVVASDLGGVRELVISDETGILVPAQDVKAFASAVRDLIQDEKRRLQMGERGFWYAREQFDAKRNAGKTFAVYEEL